MYEIRVDLHADSRKQTEHILPFLSKLFALILMGMCKNWKKKFPYKETIESEKFY